MPLGSTLFLAAASLVAGGVNAVAGGGSLISFPAAMASGLSSVVANATNAAAMTPASLASAWGYKRELADPATRARLRHLAPPSVIGGVGGSVLLLVTPARVFDGVVPVLVLFATLLLLAQNLRARRAEKTGTARTPLRPSIAWGMQLLVSVYGGYFGAGMGIMMLAMLELLEPASIHRQNGVKSLLAIAINGAASVYFVIAGAVDLHAAVLMAVCASVGGWLGARIARATKPAIVRWGIVAFGLGESVYLFLRFLGV